MTYCKNVAAGETLKHSSTQSGRVVVDSSSVGTFAIALQTVAPDTPRGNVKAVFKKNENF